VTVNVNADTTFTVSGLSFDNRTWTISPQNAASQLQLEGTGGPGSPVTVAVNTTTTIATRLTGTAQLVKTGTAGLTLTNDNTYSGGTTISQGTLFLGNGGATGSVTGNILNNATLTINKSSSDTISGNITGTGTVNLNGTGTQTFTGANTYTGVTTISSSQRVYVASGATLGGPTAGTVTVSGTARLGGEGTVGGTTSFASGTSLDPGDGTTNDVGVLSFSQSLFLNSGANYRVNFLGSGSAPVAGVNYDQVLVGGSVDITGANLVFDSVTAGGTYTTSAAMTILDAAGTLTGRFAGLDNGALVTALAGFGGVSEWFIFYDDAGGSVTLAPIPEPASVLGVAVAGLGLARWVRRRRSRLA
jgi:autotransporter-associated beta strand protein